ncbi:MAG TPA: hypothetical protein VHX67_09580 [Acidimicrobiales bacterium]|nr:hypothetical protein [Acidimicrobiales bacterium]
MSATPRDEPDEVESADVEPAETEPDPEEYIDGQEEDSFPASDPHSDWSGPPEHE